jgi:bifunctional DNA-binding transcriptional regulator/antitoxin component of YhaV-PrlF toxin-antitoxin module
MKIRSLEKISKVRQRGQLTIPSQIRRALNWPATELAVKVEPLQDEDAVKIKRITAQDEQVKKPLSERDWKRIWENMQKVSKMGRQDVNLTEFLIADRERH